MYNAIQVSNRQKHQPLNSYISLSEEFTEDNIFDQLVISNPESIIIDQETARDMEQRILKNLSPFEREVFTCRAVTICRSQKCFIKAPNLSTTPSREYEKKSAVLSLQHFPNNKLRADNLQPLFPVSENTPGSLFNPEPGHNTLLFQRQKPPIVPL